MTIQEKAIQQLERISNHLSAIGENEDYTDIAIQALEKGTCEDCISRKALLDEIENGIKAGNYEEGYEEYTHINDMDDIIECIKYADSVQPKAEQEDCISRQAVLDEISKSVDHSLYAYKSLMECVKTLPSVTPQEPKTNVALERYKDLQDYFGEDIAKTVLENQTEFKAWLERLHWNSKKVDELARKIQALEQQSCEDCISREQVIRLFEQRFIELQKVHQQDKQLGVNWCINTIKDMPSVKPKTGHWIMHLDSLFPTDSTMECSMCGEHQPLIIDDNYCPNCGCRMIKESEVDNDKNRH